MPALGLPDGEVLTEGALIVQYVADQNPDSEARTPAWAPKERRRLAEWLHFIATELQKGISPLNNPKATDELKQALRQRLDNRFAFLAKNVADKPYLLGDTFSVADGYAYYVPPQLAKARRRRNRGIPRAEGVLRARGRAARRARGARRRGAVVSSY